MKLRTVITLGLGYVAGVKLPPQRIEALVHQVLPDGPIPTTATDGDPLVGAWPDAEFRV